MVSLKRKIIEAVLTYEMEKIYNYVDSIFIVEGTIKTYKNKKAFYDSEDNTHRH